MSNQKGFKYKLKKYNLFSSGSKTNPDETIKLVEGLFSSHDAAEVLRPLINHKIKFRSLQLLSITLQSRQNN